MHACPGAQLPHARVGLVVGFQGLLAHSFQSLEFGCASAVQQALVVKGLRCAQHHIAVDVVLKMLLRLVTDPYRPHAAVTAQVRHDGLGQISLQTNAEQRLDVPAVGLHHHIAEPAQIVFQRANFGQAVERPHHKKCVA